jgi:hypothetical protein
VRVAEAPYARLRPSIQSACPLSCAVEHAGNGFVGHQSRTGTDQLHRLGLDGPPRLTPLILSHRQAGVIAALPMQQQMNLVTLDARHDLAQHAYGWRQGPQAHYDHELADVFVVQDEITEAIVAAIEPTRMIRLRVTAVAAG